MASVTSRAEQDAGAYRLISRCALVHGFHPHVVLDVEMIDGGWSVAGSPVFHQGQASSTPTVQFVAGESKFATARKKARVRRLECLDRDQIRA
jgi:hypothetical protein